MNVLGDLKNSSWAMPSNDYAVCLWHMKENNNKFM
jgi:hypothetical protein